MTARILVVDDATLNVKLLTAKLEHEYYIVSSADNGFKALQKIDKEPPDLVLLDVMMPGMDGFEVCRRIKADPATAYIPVVMVTALTDVTDRVKGLEAGADDFLTKPINDLALMARVRSLLRLKTLMDEWRLREKTALHFAGGGLSSADAPSIAGSRVILLEDDGGDRDFIEKTLLSLSAQVECVNRIADATSMARTGYYDIVMASLNLGHEDALTICAQLRSNEMTRHIPIIFLGTESDMGRIAKGFDLGANDYLLRPLDANELIARTRTQLRHKKHYDNLQKNYENSLSLSLVDPLTGAFNRRYMEAHLPRMLERAGLSDKELSVLMIDVDHFKSFNDVHGHAVGDFVLKSIVTRILNGVRPSDLVARLGGEEFVVIMPETPLATAEMVAERLRKKIDETPVSVPDAAEALRVTVSIGCASTANKSHGTQTALLEHADAALYQAKNQGRNRVIAARGA
jgi:two-component system cell cycle response regulator